MGSASASSAKWAYVDAYNVVDSGDWYIGEHNEGALLAWGESYVMMSLASMYRATKDPKWLDELSRHIDGVLLPYNVGTAPSVVTRLVEEEQVAIQNISMAEARLQDGQSLLAFNDLFIGAENLSSKD